MSSKPKDKDERARDRREREKEKEREKDRDSDVSISTATLKDRHRPFHGSGKRSSREKDKDRRPRSGCASTSSLKDSARSDATARPLSASLVESRASLPYPTFSKAHSKLSVKPNVLTPEPTDITTDERGEKHHSNGNKEYTQSRNTRPPSPPLTHDEPVRRRSTPGSSKVQREDRGSATGTRRSHEEEKERNQRAKSSRSSTSSLRKAAEQHSRMSTKSPRPSTPKFKILDAFQFPHRSSAQSKQKNDKERESSRKNPAQTRSSTSPRDSLLSERNAAKSASGSGATYIAPHQPRYSQPTVHVTGDGKKRFSPSTPAAPPPPPPLDVPAITPKVDYLLQHGGLGSPVARNLLLAGEPPNMSQQLTRPGLVGPKLFEPFTGLLDEYGQVLTKNGSLAVATGYRSVARRLLDRLEAVFSRDISSEACGCFMCCEEEHLEEGGVSWGEILELVSGREDLPSWPPFYIGSDLPHVPSGGRHTPMQKLDIDVPKEYRDHYIAQSKKTKDAVDKWLSRQPHQSNGPPNDVDDETLAFAMLTYLEDERRELFRDLLEMPKTPPAPKKESPRPRERPQIIVRDGLALQRLYRLARPPRDPETAIYLVNNPQMHHVLATLAAISDDEWDILTSGRFDGFLRSGAEDDDFNTPPSRPASRFANGRSSRSSMRSSTASFGAPISVDEETEIEALAEIERDIFFGMEALEDAFEALHCKAEAVRRAVRERGAGLTASRARRGGFTGGVEILSGTPRLGADEDTMTDDGIDDMASIAPSDSASNISSSRRRRPKRRTERRTPAPVEEEDEEV